MLKDQYIDESQLHPGDNSEHIHFPVNVKFITYARLAGCGSSYGRASLAAEGNCCPLACTLRRTAV